VQFGGQPFGQLVLAGRASPGGAVDDLVLNAGHWPDGPGQVVLDGSPATGQGGGPQVGSNLPVTGVPGAPALTVVGFAEVTRALPPGAVTGTGSWFAAENAAPAAVALTTATLNAMAGTAHTGIPASFSQVFPPPRLALLSLAALAIAAAGALLPAGWAARARPATALCAE
jgi:hypothetical protein